MAATHQDRQPSLLTKAILCATAAIEGAYSALFPVLLHKAETKDFLSYSSQYAIAQVALAGFTGIFWGILADQNTLRRKSILALGSIGVGIVFVLVSISRALQIILLMLALGSGLVAALEPISDSIIADVTSETCRGRVIGYVRSARLVGMLVSSLVAMLVTDQGDAVWLGWRPWRGVFAFLGLLAASISLLIGAFLREPPPPSTNGLKSLVDEVADLVKLFRIPSFGVLILEILFCLTSWRIMSCAVHLWVRRNVVTHWSTFWEHIIGLGWAVGLIVGGHVADAIAGHRGFCSRPLTALLTLSVSISIIITAIFSGLPYHEGSFHTLLILLATSGFFAAWGESGTNFPVMSEVVLAGRRSRAMAVMSLLRRSITWVLYLAFKSYMSPTDPSTLSIESVKRLCNIILYVACVGWIISLAAYGFLHWSYPRDVRLIWEKEELAAAAAFSQRSIAVREYDDDTESTSSSSTTSTNSGTSIVVPSSCPIPTQYRGWGMDGKLLHSIVDPARWCVTKQDLVFFSEAVLAEVSAGRIAPNEQDRFDPLDDKVGPSMHTVVEQYIKPLTARAGNMSWALLCNPNGLSCDLFISHCWAEGVFEFLDKVLHSWPEGLCAAYVCIFANPQNLNIGHMLQVPRSSPFAQALGAASHVMVVPNQRCSIYTRAWCAYEAWLAYKAEKIIFTANRRPSLLRRVLECSLLLLFPLVVGAFGFHLLTAASRMTASREAFYVQLCVSGLVLSHLALLRCCTQWSANAAAKKLRRQYAGVARAHATDPLDKQRIIEDIGTDTDGVDRSIEILLRNGMSTPTIRHLLDRGVTTNFAFDPNHLPGSGLTYFFILAGFCSLPLSLVICIRWYMADMDKRASIRSAVNNAACTMALVTVIGSFGVWFYAIAEETRDMQVLSSRLATFSLANTVATNILLCGVLGIVVAGIDRVVACPLIGLPLAWLLQPGALLTCCHCQH